MICFRNFTTPLWEIFTGNLLLLFCSFCYLVWWFVSFNPNSSGGSAGMFFIAAAFISGIAAIFLTSSGINWLSQDSKSFPVKFILLGSAVVFLILLLVTTIVFHRMVTSELLIIHIWAVLELSMVVVLYGTGHFGFGRVAILSALTGIAFVAGLICYILYYRLDGTASYWDGMIPLIIDAFVMSVFLGVLAVS
ncbi:MAG TPA: hypothetical protein VFC27_04610 [Anaerovoracaceae bacterium]|nr:hypothetical protein [Anaerovoracaceae bacterium]